QPRLLALGRAARHPPQGTPLRHRHPRQDHLQGVRGAHGGIADDDYRFPRVRQGGASDLLRCAVPRAGDDCRAEGGVCAHLPRCVQSDDWGAALGVAWAGEGGGQPGVCGVV
ncbi:hypothetical protein V494_07939, partial [Pseudogymnoascus sp. VKM F-4513 (FW-928)]